jgi:hypothetical protein
MCQNIANLFMWVDPPPGFMESLGLLKGHNDFLLAPMEEIVLMAEPKVPSHLRTPAPYDPKETLEFLAGQFVDLINQTAVVVFDNAKKRIVLNFNEFQRGT